MRTITRLTTLAAAGGFVLGLLSAGGPAEALPRTFVTAFPVVGADCSIAAPCGSFQEAHNATDPNGEINCVDPSDYGTLVITKNISIDCSDVGAAITVPAGVGIASATAGLVITVRGLSINGMGIGTNAIGITASAELHIDRCRISGFRGGDGVAIEIAPADGTSLVTISDTIVEASGLAASGGAIGIKPTGSAAAVAVLNRVQAKQNTYGVWGSTLGTTGTISMQVRDSLTSENVAAGISAFTDSSTGVVGLTVNNTSSTENATGILSQGPNSFLILGRSSVSSNQTGLASVAGGQLLSYQNNQIGGNVAAGATPRTLVMQ